jgi:uncharacterized membrane protein
MPVLNKPQLTVGLLSAGVILIALWALEKLNIASWFATYYGDMFGAIGFLIIAYLGIAQANQQLKAESEEQQQAEQ